MSSKINAMKLPWNIVQKVILKMLHSLSLQSVSPFGGFMVKYTCRSLILLSCLALSIAFQF